MISKLVLGMCVVFSSFLCADEDLSDADKKVKDVLQEADQLFKQRSISNPQLLDTILDKLAAVENKADDSDLNYDVYIFESKVLYWKAKYVLHLVDPYSPFNPSGMSILTLGKAKADAAKQLNCYAEGHYYSALHLAGLARYFEEEGPPNPNGSPNSAALHKAWKAVDDAVKEMEIATQNIIRSDLLYQNLSDEQRIDELDGGKYEGWGPYREKTLISMNQPYFHWTHFDPDARYALKKAYDNARNYAENVVGYAEILIHKGDHCDAFMASLILDLMLSHDPKTYNPDRVEETIFEFERAKQVRKYCIDTLSYQTAKQGLQDYAAATKLEEEAANRVVSNQTKLNVLNAERLSWIEAQKQQERVFSTFDLLRARIEEATPALIIKIQTYLASQEDTLQTLIENLSLQLREAQDPKVRENLQFDIFILSDLATAKQNLGGHREDLKKAMDLAIHGKGDERAKALSHFDPLTQAILKWVFDTTLPDKENVFNALKDSMTNLRIFSIQHLATLEATIQIATRDLQHAKDDQFIAQSMVTKIYEACQRAQGLL